MRLVLKVDNAITENRDCGRKLAESVASLARDGHYVAIIQGDAAEPQPELPSVPAKAGFSNGNHAAIGGGNMHAMAAMGLKGWLLASYLLRAGVPSMGLSCTDANIFHLRRKYCDSERNAFRLEASSVNPRWIEVICSNGGVPVISNAFLGELSQYGCVDPDQMAAVCAIHWNADALIYFADSAGVRDAAGAVIRYLDIAQIASLPSTSAQENIPAALLKTCKHALERGVRRVRILPVSSIESLQFFYFSRIEYGTEVVKVTEVVKEKVIEIVKEKGKEKVEGADQTAVRHTAGV